MSYMAKQELHSPENAVDSNFKAQELSNSGDAGQKRVTPAERERAILSVFREYLMTPGKMLCLSQLDRKIYGNSLANLVAKKLLVAERYSNGYSLTESGYMAMCASQTETS